LLKKIGAGNYGADEKLLKLIIRKIIN